MVYSNLLASSGRASLSARRSQRSELLLKPTSPGFSLPEMEGEMYATAAPYVPRSHLYPEDTRASAPEAGASIGSMPIDWVASTIRRAPTEWAASANLRISYLWPLEYSTCESVTTDVLSSIRERIPSGSVYRSSSCSASLIFFRCWRTLS